MQEVTSAIFLSFLSLVNSRAGFFSLPFLLPWSWTLNNHQDTSPIELTCSLSGYSFLSLIVGAAALWDFCSADKKNNYNKNSCTNQNIITIFWSLQAFCTHISLTFYGTLLCSSFLLVFSYSTASFISAIHHASPFFCTLVPYFISTYFPCCLNHWLPKILHIHLLPHLP